MVGWVGRGLTLDHPLPPFSSLLTSRHRYCHSCHLSCTSAQQASVINQAGGEGEERQGQTGGKVGLRIERMSGLVEGGLLRRIKTTQRGGWGGSESQPFGASRGGGGKWKEEERGEEG